MMRGSWWWWGWAAVAATSAVAEEASMERRLLSPLHARPEAATVVAATLISSGLAIGLAGGGRLHRGSAFVSGFAIGLLVAFYGLGPFVADPALWPVCSAAGVLLGGACVVSGRASRAASGVVGGAVAWYMAFVGILRMVSDRDEAVYIPLALACVSGLLLGLRAPNVVQPLSSATFGAFAVVFGADMLTDQQLTIEKVRAHHLNGLGWGLWVGWLALSVLGVAVQRLQSGRPLWCRVVGLACSTSRRVPTASPIVSTFYSSSRVPEGRAFRGLSNVGNSCFMNATVQALRSVIPPETWAGNQKYGRVANPLRQVLGLLEENQEVDRSLLHQMLEVVGFDDGKQHDASEFMRFLLNALIDEGPKQDSPDRNHIRDLFLFKTAGVVTCHSCGHNSMSHENAVDLSVVIPDRCDTQTKSLKLADLLTHYFDSTRLDGEDMYQCDHCDSLSPATRVTKLASLPPILAVSLGRFRYSTDSMRLDKVMDTVEIPDKLTIAGRHYALVAVVVHAGSSAEGGHYYTLAKAHTDPGGTSAKQWFSFDDRSVEQVSFARVQALGRSGCSSRESAYVLIYERA